MESSTAVRFIGTTGDRQSISFEDFHTFAATGTYTLDVRVRALLGGVVFRDYPATNQLRVLRVNPIAQASPAADIVAEISNPGSGVAFFRFPIEHVIFCAIPGLMHNVRGYGHCRAASLFRVDLDLETDYQDQFAVAFFVNGVFHAVRFIGTTGDRQSISFEDFHTFAATGTYTLDVRVRALLGGVVFRDYPATNQLRVLRTSSRPQIDHGSHTVLTVGQSFFSLDVSREVTVPDTGSEDFARTVDVFTNPTGSPITTTVRIVGNLGSDAATTVFNTLNSDGTFDAIVDATDRWIGTDDADGSGTPAIIHYIHGSNGIVPVSAQVVGDNIEWTYNLTVPASQTVRLAHFTILDATRAGAEAAAAALVTSGGFGGASRRVLDRR